MYDDINFMNTSLQGQRLLVGSTILTNVPGNAMAMLTPTAIIATGTALSLRLSNYCLLTITATYCTEHSIRFMIKNITSSLIRGKFLQYQPHAMLLNIKIMLRFHNVVTLQWETVFKCVFT